jgi:hypothetical protein
MPMNILNFRQWILLVRRCASRAWPRFPICNRAVSNGTALPLTNHRKDDKKDDGGFNEDDVMVAVSRFVLVVLAHPPSSAWPWRQAGTAHGQGGRYRRFHGPDSPGDSAGRSRPGTPGQRGVRISGHSFPSLEPDFSNQGAARRDRYLTHSPSESIA